MRVGLKGETSANDLATTVTITATVVANDNRAADEVIPIEEIEVDDTEATATPGRHGRVTTILTKRKVVTIRSKTAPLDPEWDLNLTIEVEAEGKGSV